MSPRITSAYDLFLSKKHKAKTTSPAVRKLDAQMKELFDEYAHTTHLINTLGGEDYVNKKIELERKLGSTEEMLEAVILSALEMF